MHRKKKKNPLFNELSSIIRTKQINACPFQPPSISFFLLFSPFPIPSLIHYLPKILWHFRIPSFWSWELGLPRSS